VRVDGVRGTTAGTRLVGGSDGFTNTSRRVCRDRQNATGFDRTARVRATKHVRVKHACAENHPATRRWTDRRINPVARSGRVRYSIEKKEEQTAFPSTFSRLNAAVFTGDRKNKTIRSRLYATCDIARTRFLSRTLFRVVSAVRKWDTRRRRRRRRAYPFAPNYACTNVIAVAAFLSVRFFRINRPDRSYTKRGGNRCYYYYFHRQHHALARAFRVQKSISAVVPDYRTDIVLAHTI